jgi:sterol desaturase/sphingolipid hydroxylase (fatty acid hydroxylase superfamily)
VVSRAIEYGLQPALLAGALLVWSRYGDRPDLYLWVMLGVQVILGALERIFPARPDWVQAAREKATNLVIFAAFTVFAGALSGLYRSSLAQPLAGLRAGLGFELWPHAWPMALRVMLAFLASEFIWYWLHRSEHRFAWLWRASGHGVHHSFKRLNAINFNANHPLEAFVILIPMTLVTLFLGAGEETGAAALLLLVNASVVHTNLKLNARGIGWVFTTNAYHFRHHSSVFEESNTNYGCAAILWDRLFGTFATGTTREAGIGPSEPRLWQKLLLPLRQPADVTVAP